MLSVVRYAESMYDIAVSVVFISQEPHQLVSSLILVLAEIA